MVETPFVDRGGVQTVRASSHIKRLRKKMVEKYYTRDQLLSLLDSPEISSEFREKIKAALNDGSQSAIESLGAFAVTTAQQKVS